MCVQAQEAALGKELHVDLRPLQTSCHLPALPKPRVPSQITFVKVFLKDANYFRRQTEPIPQQTPLAKRGVSPPAVGALRAQTTTL